LEVFIFQSRDIETYFSFDSVEINTSNSKQSLTNDNYKIMKAKIARIAITTICLLSIQPLLAQVPAFEWAQQIGGTTFDRGYSIAVDVSGNVYNTGYFSGKADFDPGPGTFNLTSVGSIDVFVQKIDAHGNLIWAKQMGGTNFDQGCSITVDASGNVYTTGSFEGKVDFDPGPGTTYLTSAGQADIFVQKLNTDGNLVWAKQIGGLTDDIGRSIAIDTSGNIYITGSFNGTTEFSLDEKYYDILVQKLNNNGDLLWAKKIGGTGNDEGLSITVDLSGNVYTAGLFYGTVNFDPGTGEAIHKSAGSADIFIQKLNTSGDFLWMKQVGGIYGDIANSIAVDASGNVYTTGFFYKTVDFDPGLGVANLISVGGIDIFVQKLDTNGDFLWAKQMGGISDDVAKSLALDTSANVYITGYFTGTADFDPGTGINNLTSAGSSNTFIQKLDADGDFIWAKQMGGNSASIISDVSGNIYITGSFLGTVDFDPWAGKSLLSSPGNEDIFVLKLNSCYSPSPVPDLANLPSISAMCEIKAQDAVVPTATSNCVGKIGAVPNIAFPITDQSISQIVWTYNDGSGKVVTQNQAIKWMPVNVSTSVSGLTITANNVNGTYQWIECNNNNAPISGENGRSYTAKHTGNYAVKITENGCVNTSTCFSIIISNFLEREYDERMVVYPNPSSDNFKVEFGKAVEDVVLEVTDIQGKLVSITQVRNSAEASIELIESPGIYFLSIKSKEDKKTIKLIKE